MRRANAGWPGLIILFAAVVAIFAPASAFAQGQANQTPTAVKPEALVGTYQGTATASGGGDMPLTMTLKYEKDAFTGSVDAGPQGVIPITGGTLTGDRLALTLTMGGAPATLTCTVKDPARFEGNWTAADASGTVVFTRTEADKPGAPAPAGANKPTAATAAKAGDPITGEWDGVSGNSDMSVPFTMRLKLEGDKVTGDISSDQGGAPFSAGIWKDGALNLSFELGGMGTVTMVGSFQEGKLVGSLDVGGQMQMQWAAVKKGS